MGNYSGGQLTRESRRESRRRQLRIWAYVGLGALAVATAVVVVMALRR
ncbi:hypothetical protein [Arthrobacter sp. Soil736]|nr:hypothetical protein [Arthrobacter sp. Soil736]